MATILRAPVLSSYPGRKTQPAEVWPNLLLSTLSLVSATAPVKPVSLDNPRSRPVYGQTDLVQMSLLLRQTPAQLLPIGANGYDETAQPRIMARPQDTSVGNVLLRALVPAQLMAVGQNGYDEWAQPRTRLPSAQDTLVPNALIRCLVPAQLLPVGQNDYNDGCYPARSRNTQQSDVAQNLLTSTLASQAVSAPFALDEWTQAARPRSAQADAIQSRVLFDLLPSQFLPFSAFDLGQGGKSGLGQDTQASNSLLRLLPPSAAPLPFMAVDVTQRTRITAVWQDTQSPNLLVRTLPPAQLVPIGANGYDEYSQPRSSKAAQVDVSANLLTNILAPAQPGAPLVPIDMTQRLRPTAPQDTQALNLLIRALAPSTLPSAAQPDFMQTARRPGQQTDVQANLLASTLAVQTSRLVSADWTVVSKKPTAPQDTNSVSWLLQSPPFAAPCTMPTVRFVLAAYPQRTVLGSYTVQIDRS